MISVKSKTKVTKGKIVPAKKVTATSHVPISPEAFAEIIGAFCNNMHNNEGKSIPGYSIVADGGRGRVVRTSNLTRPVDELRMLLVAAVGIMDTLREGDCAEIFKDRGPRIVKE